MWKKTRTAPATQYLRSKIGGRFTPKFSEEDKTRRSFTRAASAFKQRKQEGMRAASRSLKQRAWRASQHALINTLPPSVEMAAWMTGSGVNSALFWGRFRSIRILPYSCCILVVFFSYPKGERIRQGYAFANTNWALSVSPNIWNTLRIRKRILVS